MVGQFDGGIEEHASEGIVLLAQMWDLLLLLTLQNWSSFFEQFID